MGRQPAGDCDGGEVATAGTVIIESPSNYSPTNPARTPARTNAQSESESRPISRTSRRNSVTGNNLEYDDARVKRDVCWDFGGLWAGWTAAIPPICMCVLRLDEIAIGPTLSDPQEGRAVRAAVASFAAASAQPGKQNLGTGTWRRNCYTRSIDNLTL